MGYSSGPIWGNLPPLCLSMSLITLKSQHVNPTPVLCLLPEFLYNFFNPYFNTKYLWVDKTLYKNFRFYQYFSNKNKSPKMYPTLVLLSLFALSQGALQLVNVTTSRGTLSGYHFDQGNNKSALFYGQADIFLGVPFAQPPVGVLRFAVGFW